MSNNPNYKGKRYKNEKTVLEIAVVGLFKILWFLITLPFKGFKKSKRGGLTLDDKAYIINKRNEIETLLNSESQIELKHAVMESDKIVDFILRAKGYAGETFADRLRSAQQYIPSNLYNEIWQGHKVRNQIAHENGLNIQNIELKEAAKKLLKYTKTI